MDLPEVQSDSQESSPAHTYNGILAIKRNEIVPFVETWRDLESVIQSEISQKEKNKYIHAYMRNLEKWCRQSNSQSRKRDRDVQSEPLDHSGGGRVG